MRRKTIGELAWIAVAGGVLAFEVTSLRAALPAATRALAEQGVVERVTTLSREAGASAFQVALGAVKETARRLGEVTPPAGARETPRLAGAAPAVPAGDAVCADVAMAAVPVRHLHVRTLARGSHAEPVGAALRAKRDRARERVEAAVAEAARESATHESRRVVVTVVNGEGATRTICVERSAGETTASF